LSVLEGERREWENKKEWRRRAWDERREALRE